MHYVSLIPLPIMQYLLSPDNLHFPCTAMVLAPTAAAIATNRCCSLAENIFYILTYYLMYKGEHVNFKTLIVNNFFQKIILDMTSCFLIIKTVPQTGS